MRTKETNLAIFERATKRGGSWTHALIRFMSINFSIFHKDIKMTVSTNSVSAQFVRITESCLLQRRRANDLSPVSSFFTIITIIITIILLIIIIVIIITIIKRSSTLFHRKQSHFLLFSFSFNKYCVTGNTAFCFSSNYTYAALLAFNLRLLLKTYLQIQRVPEHLACSFAASHLLSQHTHVHTRRENDFLVLNYSKYFLA